MKVPRDLHQWLDTASNKAALPLSIEFVTGDASPRQYFRATGCRHIEGSAQTAMAVVSPATEKNPEFLQVRALFEKAGIRVPALFEADLEQGFLLLEDLGNDVLLPMLSGYSVDRWYTMALKIVKAMASIEPTTTGLTRYDEIKLQDELDLFKDWFLPGLLGLSVDDHVEQLFNHVSKTLIANAIEQPQVVVHRDFHSRNLMRLSDDELAVIDFQDAVLGPITYDVVSLLKDCYVRWPRDRQLVWLEEYQAFLLAGGCIQVGIPFATFVQWFDLMGLQRHLKVLGIFSRLCLRDGKSAYLDDLSRVLAYVAEALSLYRSNDPAIGAFAAWFSAVVLPACQSQSWYQQADVAGIDT